MAAEVGQRRAVDHRSGPRSELVLEDRVRIGAGHRVQSVEAHAKAGGEQGADRVEVEQRLHQREILGHRIDDLYFAALELDRPEAVDVDVRRIDDPVSPMALVRAKIASVIFSGAGPPALMLYLTPKSPCGPPGLWLAERMIPPNA